MSNRPTFRFTLVWKGKDCVDGYGYGPYDVPLHVKSAWHRCLYELLNVNNLKRTDNRVLATNVNLMYEYVEKTYKSCCCIRIDRI